MSARTLARADVRPSVRGWDAIGPVLGFNGPFRFLSNFYPAVVHLDGVAYRTVEHAFQAAKTLDRGERALIADMTSAGEAARAGRFVTERRDWKRIKLGVVRELVTEKFTEHPGVRSRLIATGTVFLSNVNNWGDRFLGVVDGSGHDHLAKILMDLRAQLVAGYAPKACATSPPVKHVIPFNELLSER